MDVIVSLEQRFKEYLDGNLWTEDMFPYSFWTRYLDVFDNVYIVARVEKSNVINEGAKIVSGNCVNCLPLVNYNGVNDYFKKMILLNKCVNRIRSIEGAVILRVGSQIANQIDGLLKKTKRPFGLEIVTNPHEGFDKSSVDINFRPIIRAYMVRKMKSQCLRSIANAYVTKNAIQKHFPPGKETFSTNFSSIELRKDHFVFSPKRYSRLMPSTIQLTSIGSMSQSYKGFDLLIEALAICLSRGLKLSLNIIGDGKYITDYVNLAKRLKVMEHVTFVGRVPHGLEIRKYLDNTDLFVLPSRTEGLPRTLIEAMSRGLPCIGSNVGGIPELLNPVAIFEKNCSLSIANKIEYILGDPDLMNFIAKNNLAKSLEFEEEKIRSVRKSFYEEIKKRTLKKGLS